jgi:hypothetical protein
MVIFPSIVQTVALMDLQQVIGLVGAGTSVE